MKIQKIIIYIIKFNAEKNSSLSIEQWDDLFFQWR